MLKNTALREYSHQKIGHDYGGIAGYYTPLREIQMEYKGRKILYIVGHAVIESSCCGTGNWNYVLVPGYIIDWQKGLNENGLPESTVEPVEGAEIKKELFDLIQERENTNCISFW